MTSDSVSHPPVVIVDGSAWDLSNLTSERYDYNENRPECDMSTSRRSVSEDSYLAFASYPNVNDIPEALDIDDIFQKLKANNLVKMGKVANSHLSSRSSEDEARKKEALYRQQDATSSRISTTTTTTRSSPSTPSSNRESNSTVRERRERRARHQDRYRFDQMEADYRNSSPSTRPPRQQSQSDILRQAMDNASRPGDDFSPKYQEHQTRERRPQRPSSYETGRQQAYQRQPLYRTYDDVQEEVDDVCDEEEEERMLVEVTPGNYVPLRGSAEIWDAVLNGNTTECFCFGCALQLVTVNDADMVMCVSCHTISPVDSSIGGGGLGLGMKAEDATYERRRFEETRRNGEFYCR